MQGVFPRKHDAARVEREQPAQMPAHQRHRYHCHDDVEKARQPRRQGLRRKAHHAGRHGRHARKADIRAGRADNDMVGEEEDRHEGADDPQDRKAREKRKEDRERAAQRYQASIGEDVGARLWRERRQLYDVGQERILSKISCFI